jgi:hypothetical protein
MKLEMIDLAAMRNAVPPNLLKAGQEAAIGKRMPRNDDGLVEGDARRAASAEDSVGSDGRMDSALAIVRAKPLLAGLAAAGLAAVVISGVARAKSNATLTQIADFDHQVTGVAVTADGRRFVNFPRWTDDAPISVAEVMKDGSLRPYPDARWNEWRNARASELAVGDHFVCVQWCCQSNRTSRNSGEFISDCLPFGRQSSAHSGTSRRSPQGAVSLMRTALHTLHFAL